MDKLEKQLKIKCRKCQVTTIFENEQCEQCRTADSIPEEKSDLLLTTLTGFTVGLVVGVLIKLILQ